MTLFGNIIQHFTALCVFILVIRISKQQTGYTIIHERAELAQVSANDLATNISFKWAKYNRTSFALSAKFVLLEDVPDPIKAKIQVYKFLSNEYRYDPLKLTMNICKIVSNNWLGFGSIKDHMTLDACHPKKGPFILKDYLPDTSKFPSMLIPGRYKCVISIVSDKRDLFVVNWYAAVQEKNQ